MRTRPRGYRLLVFVATLACVGLVGSTGYAQRLWGQGPRGWFFREPPKAPTKESFDGSFNYCRAAYTSARREPGGTGWSTDYPGADINFSIRLAELTKTRVKLDGEGEPDHVVVKLTDDALFQCPMLFMEDVGTARFSDEEVVRLREYFLKGGFLWVDDFWGSYAWENWVSQIERVLPGSEYPIYDVTLQHPLFHDLFPVARQIQVPSIQFWRTSGGGTSERGADSAQPHFRGINDHAGRLIVFMTHNTDISDTWEREGEEREYFFRFSPEGYAIGIDVVLYAMTH